jgi:hypothetical protein
MFDRGALLLAVKDLVVVVHVVRARCHTSSVPIRRITIDLL